MLKFIKDLVEQCGFVVKYGDESRFNDTEGEDSITIFIHLYDKLFWWVSWGESMKHVIDHNYTTYFDKDMLKQLYILFRFKAFSNHYKYISRKFKNEALRDMLTFQNLYLGQNPRQS